MRRWWTRWKRRENESIQIYYQFKAVVRYCELIDWVGGQDGKIFGSRSWRTDRAQHRGPSAMTESQIFPIQPDLTQSLRILSYEFLVLEKFEFFFLKYYAIDRRARNNHKNDSKINTFPFCPGTGNSHFIEKRGICFQLYSLLSLIFGQKRGQCCSFQYFLPKCTRAGRLFPDREPVSLGSGNLTGP